MSSWLLQQLNWEYWDRGLSLLCDGISAMGLDLCLRLDYVRLDSTVVEEPFLLSLLGQQSVEDHVHLHVTVWWGAAETSLALQAVIACLGVWHSVSSAQKALTARLLPQTTQIAQQVTIAPGIQNLPHSILVPLEPTVKL